MPSTDAAALLAELRNGNHSAVDRLFPLVYADLRKRARAQLRMQPEGHTLTTTALVHETYLKLIAAERTSWQDRAHFMALAATAMRHVLVDYARHHNALKRGGGRQTEELKEDASFGDATEMAHDRADLLLALDSALERLTAVDPRLGKTVELRFFGGMTVEETAEALSLAPSTVKLDWQKAKAWLYHELAQQ